jgi:hypothetical protein
MFLFKTRAYGSYKGARHRCNDPHNPGYRYYGGRGILFLLPPFAEFLAILGERPVGYELDRIDPLGHYEIGNVRWVPRGTGARQRKGWYYRL